MKILIAYYSKTGSTDKLAKALKTEFEARGHRVDMERVKVKVEHSFWGWWFIRMFKSECDIQPPKIKNVTKYDLICLGSPNWTRVSLPIARYIRGIKGLEHKSVGFFATTILWPQIEWYILSAYLLDLTFSKIVEKRGGRIIDGILLSSFFKRWNYASKYGKKVIQDFCNKLNTPIVSLKSYFLEQKEIESSRLLVVIFTFFLFLFFVFQITSSVFDSQIISWSAFFYVFLISLFTSFAILTTLAGKRGVFLGKYLASISLLAITTILILFLSPNYVIHGRSLFLGYVLIFIILSLFRDLKVVLFSGLITVLSYLFLFFNYPHKEIFIPNLDLSLLFLTFLMFGLITQNLQNYYLNLLNAQEEAETAKASLEIKVNARTRELRELSESLEEQVKERTKELQGKIEELERFNKLAMGRELKMVELKEEIKRLNKELKKVQKKN